MTGYTPALAAGITRVTVKFPEAETVTIWLASPVSKTPLRLTSKNTTPLELAIKPLPLTEAVVPAGPLAGFKVRLGMEGALCDQVYHADS
jgi:hypothetical protein